MHALVADAHLRNAVAAVRALGRAGVGVVALGATRAAAGRWSREALARELGPDPAEDSGGFAEALADAAARHGGLAVYPSQETTIDALARLEPQLPDGTVLPYPEGGVLARLREKRSLPALASEHGLRAPRTLFDGTAAALASAADGLPPDVVVKPAGAVGNLPSARAVRSHAALRELADGLPPDEPVIVQERIRGRLLSLAVVIDRDGRTADRFQEEATRTWPREAGSFAATVSMEPDEDLVERARAMLAGAGYFGLAQLDLALDGAEVVLLDVNPRFYACMPLALACGVNLPAAWHAVVDGRPAGSPRAYPAGRRYRWLEGDLYAARHGDLRGVLRPGPRADAGAMWDGADPVASVLLAGAAATLPLRRRLRAVRGGR